MYDSKDPRAALKAASKPAQGPFDAASVARFYAETPQESSALCCTWYVRGQNFIIGYSQCEAGAVLERQTQPDEYMLLLPERDTVVAVTAGGATQRMEGLSLVCVPPGASRVEVLNAGPVYRLISTQSADLAALCSNAGSYATPHAVVAPLQAWPTPPGGLRLRRYSLDVPLVPGRFGRIFRCTTFMVNFLHAMEGQRDPTQLSPHHHDDFEQCSLAVSGAFTHHLRWPWTVNKLHWHEDAHEAVGAPSVCVIPPPSLHTSEATGPGTNQLVDIFSPPRMDFSLLPGWVLNADDYPMPEGNADA